MSLMTTISTMVMKDFTSKLQKMVKVQGFENAEINFAIMAIRQVFCWMSAFHPYFPLMTKNALLAWSAYSFCTLPLWETLFNKTVSFRPNYLIDKQMDVSRKVEQFTKLQTLCLEAFSEYLMNYFVKSTKSLAIWIKGIVLMSYPITWIWQRLYVTFFPIKVRQLCPFIWPSVPILNSRWHLSLGQYL